MFLELLNDLFINSPTFYLYFGIVLMTIGISQLFYLRLGFWKTRTNIYMDKSIKVYSHLMDKAIIVKDFFIIWFIRTFKRIDKPDDDKEDDSSSYFKHHFKIRGGQLWKETSYSLLLKSISLY